jgi:hypothetical protein
MPTNTPPMISTIFEFRIALRLIALTFLLGCGGVLQAQDDPALLNETPSEGTRAEETSEIGSDGTATIIVETHGKRPEPKLFYTAVARATATLGIERVEQAIQLTAKVIQGKAKTLSFGLNGEGGISSVEGAGLRSWSVRREGNVRFLDLQVVEGLTELQVQIATQSPTPALPAEIGLLHLTPGDSIGFDSIIEIKFAPEVEGNVKVANGFAPLDSIGQARRFQTITGGELRIDLSRDGASPGPVELVDTTLTGTVHPNGKSVLFQLRSTAMVSVADAELAVLSGNAAVSQMPQDANYRLVLSSRNESPVYKLMFEKAGVFPLGIDFVARVETLGASTESIDFSVATGAVVPLKIAGLKSDLEFQRHQDSVVPIRSGDDWLGFLPATGRAQLQWKVARTAGEGKLFFTTSGTVEASLGAGLLRQDHRIDYKVLQGELSSLSIDIRGPGEIIDVELLGTVSSDTSDGATSLPDAASNIVGWNIVSEGETRRLVVTLSQPFTGERQIKVRSQTPLGAFPVRVEGLRLNPIGAVRHSGFLRLVNSGSVRLEPIALTGLTQLSPEQFPGEPSQARQTFVYRFPSAEHAFSIAADRIQPEVNISELLLFELTETDRVIHADIELDIREAPIREWDFNLPSDYSIVAVTGASVADYIASTEALEGRRNLKVVFNKDVVGRQLISLHLEKSEPVAAGDWSLARIDFPEAKTIRGDVGVVGAPGFRLAVATTDLLVEKPLSYFPKQVPQLQQAFRIREPGWSATMRIEMLERSVQADVFHLYSLSEETVYGSALINYFVTGSPVSELKISAPETLGNVMIDGQSVRTWRREGETLIVSLHQPVMGAYTLLVTFQEKPDRDNGSFRAAQVAPLDVQGERGYIQVVSPMQVEITTIAVSADLLKLDPLELPAELRLLSTAPPLGTWQYTERPFDLNLKVTWFQPGTMVDQIIEFAEANSRVSKDGELVTDVVYFIKSRGQRTLRIKLPAEPVRLWEVKVAGQPVTARQSEDATLIPLPGGIDPNVPVEVSLRLGKPTVDEADPVLMLPLVYAPVLKTQWSVVGDEKHVLVPSGGTVAPPVPVLRPTGLDWVAKEGLPALSLIGLVTLIGVWTRSKVGIWRALGLFSLSFAVGVSIVTATTAFSQSGPPEPLQLSLPILASGESVELLVHNTPLWQINLFVPGLVTLFVGALACLGSLVIKANLLRMFVRGLGLLAIALGVLLQGDGATWFFLLLAIAIFFLLLLRPALEWIRSLREQMTRMISSGEAVQESETRLPSDGVGPIASAILFALAFGCAGTSHAQMPDGFKAADSIQQEWQVTRADNRLIAKGTMKLTGAPGDQFVLLRAPGVLTQFSGKGLRLTKSEVPGQGLSYIISIPVESSVAQESDKQKVEEDATDDSAAETPDRDTASESESANALRELAAFEVTYEYQLEGIKLVDGVPVLTGNAAVHEIALSYDEAGWDVQCPTAVRIDSVEDTQATRATILLGPVSNGPVLQGPVLQGPGQANLFLRPKARDVRTEQTQFFVEASNIYLPGPGVVDGKHRLNVRTSQGQVRDLHVVVPQGLTVSSVEGPVGSWQFDADTGGLRLEIEPAQSQTFDVIIETQRSLDPLPADIKLAPLKVTGANGEVGLLAIAFGPDAQPEKSEPTQMSAVNLGDFDATLISNQQAVLHRVYRYGAEGGDLAVRVIPVDSEVRVVSKQVLSLGDERVLLSINFAAEITRAGLFQLSFALPAGLEVESLTGDSLHHWSEVTEGTGRQIVLHLNGKTIGTHSFALALTGASPTELGDWEIPRFELKEANRQTGDLVVSPTTGIRLRTVTRQNVSETDPRAMGGDAQGSLAFRLLQRDWNLVLGIEKLEPWVTGQVLHEVTMREGQTRTALLANFSVQSASIRALQVVLPLADEDEIKTLRASGSTVSDFVRTAPDSNIWEIQFKRRVVGKIEFRIEYERRGDRTSETLSPAGFPQARQLSYYFGVRAGGRLELEHSELTDGWQQVDWTTVPPMLREAENRSAPVFTLRAVSPSNGLIVTAKRHSLADALKLRIAKGLLTTVLSPTGDQLTAVDVTIEVIQRSSLTVGLPAGGELFSIFVNGESVNSIRQNGDNNAANNAWQFYILPGIDDRTAKVRFVYSVKGEQLSPLNLSSPELNVPLENILWNVVAPRGFELIDNDGNLELIRQTNQEIYDRKSYLSKASGNRQVQAQQAAQLLEQANRLLQAGDQTKAGWAFNSVANQYALDAASNEDARVQLENLQTQQAIVGLNTRRQRLFLDNSRDDDAMVDNRQFREAAADNPILQQDQLNFRPQQLSELLRGNTKDDNATLGQIATRLVQHQHTTEPAPQAIIISLPEEGSVYTFTRSVQVAENAPLQLDLDFGSQYRLHLWQILVVAALLIGFATAMVTTSRKTPPRSESR